MKKQTLIILPGWGGSKETWSGFTSLLPDYFNAACFDLPCFGTEPCPSNPWGVEEYAKFVYKKIIETTKSNPEEKLVLVGHSFGGQVAVKLISEHPELFSDLILIGAAIIRPEKKIRRWFLERLAKAGKFFFSFPAIEDRTLWFKKVFYAGINARDYAETSGVKREIFKKIIRQDLSNLLPNITIPTLVIWGENDAYVSLKDGKKIAKLLPNSTLNVVIGGRHGLHLQDPKNLLEIISKYLIARYAPANN